MNLYDDEGNISREGNFRDILHRDIDVLEAGIETLSQQIARSAVR